MNVYGGLLGVINRGAARKKMILKDKEDGNRLYIYI
jgi:hypothetical protein